MKKITKVSQLEKGDYVICGGCFGRVLEIFKDNVTIDMIVPNVPNVSNQEYRGTFVWSQENRKFGLKGIVNATSDLYKLSKEEFLMEQV